MTDRELIELAAKAAGLEVCGIVDGEGYPTSAIIRDPIRGAYMWNPRNDDGDALRLANKLEFSIHRQNLSIGISQYSGARGYIGGWLERSLDDDADTRRAITRAAAEIGKSISTTERKV